MAMENICLYNKFGHCKYQETCRRQHLREICELPLCENKSCMRRHPRACKFFENYERCKFGSFCSNNVEISEMKTKLDTLEETARQHENEIKILNEKVKDVEQRNVELETELKIVLESVKTTSEKVVKEATEVIIKVISKQQDALETRCETTLNNLTDQLAMIFQLLQPQSSSQQPARNNHQPES